MSRNRPAYREQGGRQTRLLDPGVHRNIVEAIELGVPITLACQAVGVAEQSYRNWLRRGLAENENRADDTYDPDPHEQPYVDFYLAITEARGKAAFRNVAVIQKAAQGGSITNKTVRKYRDSEGNLVEEESVSRTAPDWRAAAWYLERSHRSEYGKDATQIELVTPTAATDDDERPTTTAGDLAARLAEHMAAGAVSLPALTAAQTDDDTDTGEVYDGELVEE